MIEQKVGEASKEVGKEFKLYGGFVLAAIALVGIFGIKPLAEWYKQYIEEKVTEKYVSDAVQNQLNQFSTDTIQPLWTGESPRRSRRLTPCTITK